jgi:hypothetical protein
MREIQSALIGKFLFTVSFCLKSWVGASNVVGFVPAVATQSSAISSDFVKIEGVAHRIALGAYDGKFLAMMVGLIDRKIYKMDAAAMQSWERVKVKNGDLEPEKFEDIAVAADGTVGALADTGALYISYDGGNSWKNLDAPKALNGKPIVVDRVAIASKKIIAVLDKETACIFIYDKEKWKSLELSQAESISAGYPNILLAVNKTLDCYKLEDGNWKKFLNPLKIGRFAILNNDTMYGTREQGGRFCLQKFENNLWTPVIDSNRNQVVGIKQVVVNSDGALLVMRATGELLRKTTLDLPVSSIIDAVP